MHDDDVSINVNVYVCTYVIDVLEVEKYFVMSTSPTLKLCCRL